MDGKRGYRRIGQSRSRLQRVEPQHIPVDPVRRTAVDRSAERPLPGRDGARRRNRCSAKHVGPLGDYSGLSVDPSDDCTFWYTTEYYTAASQATSTGGWLTRIGSF